MLDRFRQQYDIVLTDTAPIHAYNESIAICRYANQVVMMVQWQKTPMGAVETALRKLRDAGVHPSGCILTQVSRRFRDAARSTEMRYMFPYQQLALELSVTETAHD